MDPIIALIKQDPIRVRALACVAELDLPQCYIAAGFVRNLVWDALHQYQAASTLNDVDVIYFEPNESNQDAYREYEARLTASMPELNWQVRNQAIMHSRNSDKPYRSSLDAMSYWPEKETAVAIRQISPQDYECIAAFGFKSLWRGDITHNPKRPREIFEHRVTSKGWLIAWPKLRINIESTS